MARTESDLDLGEWEHDEPLDFPPPERKIFTQAYDLSVSTLAEQWKDGQLVIPDFQREYVWSNARASRLIESLLLNIPIPVVYLAETDDAQLLVVDGHQRIFSVVRYLDNQFPLSGLRLRSEFKGLRFHKLPPREQRFLKARVIRAIIIGADSHPTMKFEVFERLNTGGVALNAQELRSALYRGTLTELLRTLEQNADFRSCIDRKSPRRRFVDQELVLRFLALHDGYAGYRPPLIRFLNEYMLANQNADDLWIEDRTRLFEITIKRVSDVFGKAAFRVTDGRGHPTENNINRALFDAQMLSMALVEGEPDLIAMRRDIRSRVAQLYKDDDFDDAIRRATGDRARIRSRVSRFAEALSEVGLTVRKSFLAEPKK